MAQQKFITSHRFRVKRAKEFVDNSPYSISLVDREAIVEFYLLEDVCRLLKSALKESQEGYKEVGDNGYGQQAFLSNIAKFDAMLKIFESATNVAWAQIVGHNYKAVWKSIPEHALMVASSNLKNLPTLKLVATGLVKTLMEEALEAQGVEMSMDEYLESAKSHDANVRAVQGLPSPTELKAVIDALDVVVDDVPSRKNKINPNGIN